MSDIRKSQPKGNRLDSKALFQGAPDMRVNRVTESIELQPNSVYLIPPGKNLIVEANLLRLQESQDFFILHSQGVAESFYQETVLQSPAVFPGEKCQVNDRVQQRILDLEHQLQHSRENFQALIEELQTTNKEQQASHKELIAANEKLHQVNIEYQAKIEYRAKIQELTQLNNELKSTLEKLENREDEITKFFQLSLDMLCIADLEGYFKKITPSFEKILGYSAEELLARPLIDFVHPDDVSATLQKLQKLTEVQHGDWAWSSLSHLRGTCPRLHQTMQCLSSLALACPRMGEWGNGDKPSNGGMGIISSKGEDPTAPHRHNTIGFENRYRCKDGSYRWFKWIATSYQRKIYAIAQDITEQKLSQELQNRQLAAIETASEGIAILNDNKFIYLNQSHLEIFGYSKPEELIGQSWQLLYGRESIAQFEREAFPILLERGQWQGITKAKHRSGHTFDEEVTLTLTSTGDLICVCRDISDRVNMERSLRESESRFRYLYQNTPVMLYSIDREGKIISVSNYWLEKMGYTREEVIGRKSVDFLTPESRKYAQDVVLPEYFSTGCCHDILYQWVSKDGKIIDGLVSAISEQKQGKMVHSLAVIIDVTERRQQEQLKEANRAKDTFIAHMSHELRSPLTSILGFTNLLQRDSQLNSQQLHYVDIVHSSGRHLLNLINDLLDFSKITAEKLQLEPQDFNFVQFLNEIVTVFPIHTQKKGLKFKTNISPSLPTIVNADETKLRQVLYNLLSNAIKFTETGGVVTLKVGYVEDFQVRTQEVRSQERCDPDEVSSSKERPKGYAERYALAYAKRLALEWGYPLGLASRRAPRESRLKSQELKVNNNNDEYSLTPLKKIRFQIEDTGIGIPTNKLADIFAPFGQLNGRGTKYEGTGLGLTISQNIIRLMGSHIQLESEVNRGSKFWFDLELLAVETNLVPKSSTLSLQPAHCLRVPRKVLIVDDNDDNRNLLVNYLQPKGFILEEANNGEVGLATAATFQPDAILVDLIMPVMDGKEMITRIKQQPQFQDPVIIMISANSQLILKPSEVNCHGFLAKPVNLEQLLELLDSYLHLDWQSCEFTPEPDDSYPPIAPPQQELRKLLKLAELGDIEAIEEQIDSLETSDSQYLSFAQEVRQLVASCQQNKLEVFLKGFIQKQETIKCHNILK